MRDRPDWHYVNTPIVLDGVVGPAPGIPNILTALEEATERLRKPTTTDAERAVALGWLFHLVGDVHQPLHTVSLFSALYPDGDRGDTRFYVRVTPTSATISLHYLWDNVLGQETGVRAVWNRATALLARPDLAPETFSELAARDFAAWVRESAHHPRETAYPTDVAGGRDRELGAVLPEGYGPRARALGERRVVLAGYRLAALLAGLVGTPRLRAASTSPRQARCRRRR